MRPILSVSIAIVIFLAGCAGDGVVVRKICQPRADSTLVGTEGVHAFVFRGPTGTSRLPVTVPPADFWTWERERSERCTFLLRDQQGNIRSQLVTAEVFGRYQVGDYFNDCQAGPQRRESYDDGKTVRPLIIGERHVARHGHRTAHLRKRHRSHHVAAKRSHHRSLKKREVSLRGSRARSEG